MHLHHLHLSLWTIVSMLCCSCYTLSAPIANCSTSQSASIVCSPGLDQSAYAHRLIRSLDCPSQLTLPSRLVGSVLLSDGQIHRMQCVRLQRRPIRQICANDTLGALQLQVKIPSASIEYAWSFGEYCEGSARVAPQHLYLDFNLEQSLNDKQARLLSSFTSALLNTKFDIQIDRCDSIANRTLVSQQVALICKKVAIRDVDTSVQQLFRNRLVTFAHQNPIELTTSPCSVY